MTSELDPPLAAARAEIEHLRVGLRSRQLIGMAQGMLMLRYGLNEDQAFLFLRRTSEADNVKLRDVAARIVAELSQQRWPSNR